MNTKYLTSVKIFYTLFFFPTLLIMMTLKRIYGVFVGIVDDFSILIDIWILSPKKLEARHLEVKEKLAKLREVTNDIHSRKIDSIGINIKNKTDKQVIKEITSVVKKSLEEARKNKQ